MDNLDRLLKQINAWVWGPWMLVLFMGTGIFLTVRLKLLPWKNLGFALRQVWQDMLHPKGSGDGDISPFQSLMTALAAMMGTGNIVGVATAMVLGGPGALVWMILSALVGMASNFSETVLSMKYRKKNGQGQMCGGPMYVLEQGFHPRSLGKLLGILFAVFTLGASFGMGNMTQSNSMAAALLDTFGIPTAFTGGLLFFLSLLVLLGGIGSIGRVCGFIVPAMSALYFSSTLMVIFLNRSRLPEGIGMMLAMAFSPKAVAGGLGGTLVAGMGKALRFGIARGVFSNEAGLGSAPIAAAAAKSADSVRQGYVTMTGTFFDTIVVCTATGLAIASSGLLGTVGADGQYLDGIELTNAVFESALGPFGQIIITLGIALFAFATIIGWEYYGEKALEFLLRQKKTDAGRHPSMIGIYMYRFLYCGAVYLGAVASLETVWNFSDIMNGCMAVPNLICLLVMHGQVRALALDYQP